MRIPSLSWSNTTRLERGNGTPWCGSPIPYRWNPAVPLEPCRTEFPAAGAGWRPYTADDAARACSAASAAV
ncbi:hypothetical protein GCM10009864_73250 [Streptomyces lunalinharesii]|uniref:Uncharacterized protein n=1 Tax=Streptomyces lunalinharesii TaxID=333384 RepID=A0ABP6FCA9_9ACTN